MHAARKITFRTFATMVSVAAVELSLAVACGAQSLPEPTGAYPVGRMTVHLVAASRTDEQGSPADPKRQFTALVWYPAASGPEGTPAPYVSAEDTHLAEKVLGSKVLASIVVETHAREQTPLADSPKRFPVLVFAAGSTTMTEMYSSLVEDLASRGFVAIGYGPTVIGLGTWKGDLTHVLDQLGVWNTTQGHMFFGRLDLDRVGAFGHSAGGSAVAAIAAGDKRLKAIALLDPGSVRPEDGPVIPALVLTSNHIDLARSNPDIVREKTRTQNEFLLRAKPGIRITLLGAVHLSFTDMAVIKAFELPGDGNAFIDTTRAVIGGFFGQYLMGEHSELIEKGSAEYPLAKVETPH